MDPRDAVRFVPDVARLLRRLAHDPAIGRGVRWRLALLLAYLALPLDLVPDFVPVLGHVDDVIVAAVALRLVARHAGAGAIDAAWDGSPAGLALVRRLAGQPSP
jgi:uncharacterized membrane protein YkvA (DUF1232 family)